MSTLSIFMFAVFVFLLMSIGIILTMLEFNRLTEDPSTMRKWIWPKRLSTYCLRTVGSAGPALGSDFGKSGDVCDQAPPAASIARQNTAIAYLAKLTDPNPVVC